MQLEFKMAVHTYLILVKKKAHTRGKHVFFILRILFCKNKLKPISYFNIKIPIFKTRYYSQLQSYK